MEKDFVGNEILKKKYESIILDLSQIYSKGQSFLLIGNHGAGKTMMTTNVLKRLLEKGRYSGLYITLSDIVHSLINNAPEDKTLARQELLLIDFLVIDEFDPRHMGSDQGAELFGRVLEDIFRSRVQNTLPTFFCSNSPNVELSFKDGPLRQSILSLMNYLEKIPILSKDFRKEGK